jgi:hypothetical protein
MTCSKCGLGEIRMYKLVLCVLKVVYVLTKNLHSVSNLVFLACADLVKNQSLK